MNKYTPANPGGSDALARTDRGDRFLLGDEAPLPYPNETDAAESPLRQYWRILVKRRWVIAAVVLVCVVAGVLLAVMKQPQYAASTTVEIAREAEQIVEMGEQRRGPAYDPEFYQTQYSLLQSRSLAEAVVRDLRLDRNDQFLTGFGAGDPAALPDDREQRVQIATSIVRGNTEVVPVRLSSIVNIRYVSPDPQTAAAVANSLAENFIESNLARRFEANSYAREFLQTRLAEIRRRLEDSERQAVAYAGQNEIINIAPTGSGPDGATSEQPLINATLSQANRALADARTTRIAAENRYRQGLNRAGQAEALQNPTLNALRQQRAQLNTEYQRQLSDFGPEYPAMQAMRAQIAELDRQIDSEAGRIGSAVASGLEAQYREALANEREMAGLVEQLKSGAIDLRRRSIQYNIFQRDVDTNRALYDALLQRYKEIGVAGGVGTNNVSIVDPASVPGAPFSPNMRLNIMLALLLGLVLGAGAALLLEQLDEFAVVPHDFQKKLGLPLLGSVPTAGKGEDAADMLADSKSSISEAYFSILTALRFSTSHGTPGSLVVTSTQPGEGKSTTGIALAQSLARVGKRVLLVDSDLRNPSLHKKFGIANQAGFSNLLVEDGTLDQHALQSGTPNLWLLTSGPIPPNPAELLAGPSLDRVLANARDHFDHVVVDAPPVLGLADAPLLARSVEATVFVIEAGRTRTSQARQALNRLSSVRAPIAGAVLTKLDAQRSGYGYGYGYDYAYGGEGSARRG